MPRIQWCLCDPRRLIQASVYVNLVSLVKLALRNTTEAKTNTYKINAHHGQDNSHYQYLSISLRWRRIKFGIFIKASSHILPKINIDTSNVNAQYFSDLFYVDNVDI